ncbi:MAG TPA: thermostable hemolysin [Burkholderiales bacterium]|nr:thermostable hemolysin [Burkholderiales bacterium]
MRQAIAPTGRPQAAEPATPASPPPYALKLVAAAERERVERFIHAAYETAYGARITSFMPCLATVSRGTEIVAACGLRHAAGERLFVETYLGAPIEEPLSAAAGEAVARDALVEVGNLAILRPGYARLLIRLLTRHLYAHGARWVVFTAVPALRNNFAALSIPLYALGAARPERLPAAERERWGRYYDTAPQVTAVRVADAAAAIGRSS